MCIAGSFMVLTESFQNYEHHNQNLYCSENLKLILM
jgi:hypothetical protein